MQDDLHPSLQTYIDCFLSPPFPRGFPRGGGIWDQDPILMRDFRFIRDFEVKWKETQEQLERMKGNLDPDSMESGGGNGLESKLDQYISDLEEDDTF